jgi:acyl-CoA thioesterase
MGSFDESVELRANGSGRWLAFADPDHVSTIGMFGGWSAAVSIAAVLRSAEGPATPSAITTNFIAAVAPGQDVVLEVARIGGGRSVEHWRADLRPAGGGEDLVTSLLVLSKRRETDHFEQLTVPSAPEPETLEPIRAPGAQGEQTELRGISGAMASGDAESAHWMRMAPPRPLDRLELAYLADQHAPRTLFWGAALRFSATLSMTTYFHGTDEEIEAAGSDWLLAETTGSRGRHSTSDQQARIWSRQGVLLATSEQLCWYR